MDKCYAFLLSLSPAKLRVRSIKMQKQDKPREKSLELK